MLERHCDVQLEEDEDVLGLTFRNSHFQTGLKNVLDRDILAHPEMHEQFKVPEYPWVDEIPFDFSRRLMSVVVSRPEGGHRLICKGAPEEVFRRCTHFEFEKERLLLEPILVDDLKLEYPRLSADGFRVLTIPYRDFLEKSLMVLEEGTLEGRKVTNNLLYDFSQVPIPAGDVDPELIARPRPWSMKEITRFIPFIGPCSSVFDYSTYLVMWFVFKATTPADVVLCQTGWFVESLLTQTLIIHIIRTNRIPFIQSRARTPLILTSLAIMAVGIYLPLSPFAEALGLVALPPLYWPILFGTLLLYILLTQAVKMWPLKRAWI